MSGSNRFMLPAQTAARFRQLYGFDRPTPESPAASHRDASWYRCPNAYGKAPKLHVTIDGHTAACNPHQPIISEELQSMESVEPWQRCNRAGCRNRWPK